MAALPERLVMAITENGVPRVADEAPAQTLRTEGGLAVVHLRGTVELQRHGDVRPVDEPVHTVRAGGQHHGLLTILRNNNSRGESGSMLTPGHEPIRALTTAGHQSLVVPYQRSNEPGGADEQAVPTLSTRDRIALVVPYATGNEPAIADQDPASTVTQHGKHAVVWTDDDIDQCLFRMFALHEIAGAMAMSRHPLGHGYEVLGNKRERMAQYGNSVTPPAMAWLVGRLAAAGYDVSRIIDMFCGAGGSSTGAELAGGTLVLGLNHWARAIETHATNFPHADHVCEDVESLTTQQIRRYMHHARPTGMLASPECTNHTIAKGGRRVKPQTASLWEDGPGGDAEQEKSRATMWDVPRFAERAIIDGHPLEFIVVENVVDAFKWGADDDGGLFDAWLTAVDALGYRHEIVWLNSMFAPPSPDPAPQSRDRMYVVFWRKDGPTPDLRLDPPAWCPHCAKVVHGRQTWKKLNQRPWGRYGAQYLYGCPDCHGIVLPGAFPAATIIDESLPAQAIGERAKPLAKNTRERIRRGLERLAREPFAIRLTHGVAPRPLTLPLVTLTQRHDPAIVIPVAGNTHERTSGNRARRASERPLDTVHGTLDRAIVVPPMGSVDPRPAATAPSPTQTTTTRAGLVQA